MVAVTNLRSLPSVAAPSEVQAKADRERKSMQEQAGAAYPALTEAYGVPPSAGKRGPTLYTPLWTLGMITLSTQGQAAPVGTTAAPGRSAQVTPTTAVSGSIPSVSEQAPTIPLGFEGVERTQQVTPPPPS